MMPGPRFSAGRAMLAPVRYDDQVPDRLKRYRSRHPFSLRYAPTPDLLTGSCWPSSVQQVYGSGGPESLRFTGVICPLFF
jgi:hypothetical protein